MSPALLARAWALASAPRAVAFARSLAEPGRWQRRRLARLLRRHRATAFGREHGFAAIRCAAEYRERVPPRAWDAVAPWLARARAGEPRVLAVDPTTRLVPTGGSSGGAKLVPWNRGLARDFAAVIAPWCADLARSHPGALAGPAYWSISPPGEAHGGEVGFDDDAAYLGGALALLVRPLFAAPSELRLARDVDAFRYATVRCLLARADLALISVWHPSFLALLLDAAIARRDALIADVASGGCAVALPDAVRRALAPWVAPDPARAAALERADWSDARAVWPRLALVSCWSDAAAAPAARALAARLGGASIQPKGLLATEAPISVSWRGHRVAAVTGPVIELVERGGRARWLDEVDAGGEYDVVVTTSGGLWRYALGDRVLVEGFTGRAPRLRFLGRSDATCDLVGEKLDEPFVARCLAAAVPAAAFALLAPNDDGSAGYTLFADRAADAARVDGLLMANPQWRLARRLGQLLPPRVAVVAPDAHARWQRARAGAALGAVKPVALDAGRGWGARLGAEAR